MSGNGSSNDSNHLKGNGNSKNDHHHPSKRNNNTTNCVCCSSGSGTVVLSRRTVSLLGCAVLYLLCLQCFTLYTINWNAMNGSHSNSATTLSVDKQTDDNLMSIRSSLSSAVDQNKINSLLLHSNNNSHVDFTCRWYVAESAIPNSGLGIFTGIGLHKGEDIGYPDICLYVSDGNFDNTQLSSHTWGANYFGTIEGRHTRSACEGLVTIANTFHPALINTALISQEIQTNAGLHRKESPGAGAITHNYGIHGRARDIITPGSELIVDYFDWDFSDITEPVPPKRTLQWLQKYGWCVDKMDIRLSNIPNAGRGAFARTYISKGEVITPAPLQAFKSRELFETIDPEQLMVNYCLQAENSTLMFFPYGQAVGLINHSSKSPNVKYKWAENKPTVHHANWLDLSLKEFWKVSKPGGLILEVVALRDILPNEEIVIDYGEKWEKAWEDHVAQWKAPRDATKYVYPAEIDETQPLRTVKEQATRPYPYNLATVCVTPDVGDRDDEPHIIWEQPENDSWWDAMTLCHILSRQKEKSTGYITYNVSLIFSNDPKKYVYDPNVPMKDLYIDSMVPRRAIRFIDIPYMDDEHLPNAFRHPMEFPNELVPDAWRNDVPLSNHKLL